MSIYFHNEACSFRYKEKTKTKKWLKRILAEEKKEEGDINIIFTGNKTILELNNTYLNRNYLTDVIAFPYNTGELISGDVFIGIETVKENAKRYKTTFYEELHRVIVHGLLHLIGYDDKTSQQSQKMMKKESFYLTEFKK